MAVDGIHAVFVPLDSGCELHSRCHAGKCGEAAVLTVGGERINRGSDVCWSCIDGRNHALMYRTLVPIRGKSLARLTRHFSAYTLVLCALAGNAAGQRQAKEARAFLAIAKSIYRATLSALREAKTLADLKKRRNLDSPGWIGVNRFGRTVFTRRNAGHALSSMLAIPPIVESPARKLSGRSGTRTV